MAENDKPAETLDKLFGKLDSGADATVIDNEDFAGFDIRWSMKGWGFGQLLFGVEKKTGKLLADTECMGAESVKKVLDLASASLAEKLVEVDKKYLAEQRAEQRAEEGK
jgi:hypothetical protein